MSPERLLKHFEQICEAPDAILRLRQFIFDLAVRGKLTERNSTDEPVLSLLNRIDDRVKHLSKLKKIKPLDVPNPITADEIPFDVTNHWQWVRLTSIGVLSGGMTPSKNREAYWGGEINWFSPKDIKSDELIESELKITTEGLTETGLQLYPPGCLFMVARSGILKRTFPVAINRAPAAANQDLKVLNPFVGGLDRYLQIMFRGMTSYILSALVKTGTTVQSLKYEEFGSQPIPLPPLAEQHRISEKVDELMALCDKLEAAQAKREKRRARLVAATMHGLNNGNASPAPGDSPTFKESARFYLNHLPRLTTRPEHIHHLRQTILNLAVRGKLVPQGPNDEPVEILLQQIDKERVKMAEKDRRAEAAMQELLTDELRWSVPPTWGWRGLADLLLLIDYRGKTPAKADSGIQLITAKNVRKGFINLEPEEFIAEATYDSWMTRGLPREGDILFTTEAPMGNAAVVRLRKKFGLAQRVIDFRPYGGLNPDFIVLQLLSMPFQSFLGAAATGLTAKGIKAAKLKRLPLAVPPLPEQRRIVAKVGELMALCDKLEAHLTTCAADRHQLLEAFLQERLVC